MPATVRAISWAISVKRLRPSSTRRANSACVLGMLPWRQLRISAAWMMSALSGPSTTSFASARSRSRTRSRKCDREKAQHAAAVQLARLLRRIEHLQRDRVACVDERRISHERLAAALDLHELGQVAHRPARVAFALIEGASALQDFLGLTAELVLERRQITSHAELPAVLVEHAEIHLQVRRGRSGRNASIGSSRFNSART